MIAGARERRCERLGVGSKSQLAIGPGVRTKQVFFFKKSGRERAGRDVAITAGSVPMMNEA